MALFSGRVTGYGMEGSYTYQVFEKLRAAGHDLHYLDKGAFESAIKSVTSGEAEFALLPFENTTIGKIEAVHALLEESSLEPAMTVELPIHHALIGCKGSSLASVRRVVAFPVALKQCMDLITKHGWEVETHSETAGAVKDVIERKDTSCAAIGPRPTGAVDKDDYEVLVYPANDREDNVTRFGLFRSKLG